MSLQKDSHINPNKYFHIQPAQEEVHPLEIVVLAIRHGWQDGLVSRYAHSPLSRLAWLLTLAQLQTVILESCRQRIVSMFVPSLRMTLNWASRLAELVGGC